VSAESWAYRFCRLCNFGRVASRGHAGRSKCSERAATIRRNFDESQVDVRLKNIAAVSRKKRTCDIGPRYSAHHRNYSLSDLGSLAGIKAEAPPASINSPRLKLGLP
jgi:hypothetical protein